MTLLCNCNKNVHHEKEFLRRESLKQKQSVYSTTPPQVSPFDSILLIGHFHDLSFLLFFLSFFPAQFHK